MKQKQLQFDTQSFADAVKTKRVIGDRIDMRSLSKRIGVSPATLSRCERGYLPDSMTLLKLSKWMGVNPMIFVK